ncbi:YqaJ viral recombinase family protein [Streptomyces sp. OF3]|uniref:YqaJ viral recombinase family protein n=1 Tax=Streptomyces alkaliterrae TaxID=2213162 RepID=A0A7W3ZLW2_9ACTN|nr:YqaJ viral recombinase family protein [Streptomyces alkaliterrae]MBB1252880.1 YqaJ viral recombinase family protein [Streptomyces alkaliterrae]
MPETAPPPLAGELLGQYTPGTPEWEAARAGLCVTATEIAAIVGLSPWQSRFSLWHKKASLPTPPFEATPEMEWGTRLEDAIATKWADSHLDYLPCPTGTWQHSERTWQRATPDRLIHPNPHDVLTPTGPVAIFEAKTAATADGWGPSGSDEVPVHYRCQVTWQQDTLGLFAPAHLAVLIGGSDYREYVIEYHEADARLLRSAAEEFLASVRDGVRPPIDDSEVTYRTVKAQPAGRDDVDVEIPAELGDRYLDAVEQHRIAEAAKRQAAAEVLDQIGTGYRAVTAGRRIAYRTVRDGRTHSLTPYRQKDAA